jgi:hypothetical protein
VRLTFEASTIGEILQEMSDFRDAFHGPAKPGSPQGPSPAEVFADQPPEPSPREAKKRDNIAKELTAAKERIATKEKQDVAAKMAKLRAARTAKAEARKAAEEKPVYDTVEKPVEEPVEEPALEPVEKLEPVDLVALRTKTLAELQSAYANGKDREVLELLSRFGNGAKTFRELKPDMFVPIREAIDLGALT